MFLKNNMYKTREEIVSTISVNVTQARLAETEN